MNKLIFLCKYIITLGLLVTFGYSQVDVVAPNTFRVNTPNGSLRLPYYTNYPLEVINEDMSSAIVVIHGSARNALNAYETMLEVVDLGMAINTLVVAPQFLTTEDLSAHNLANDYFYWSENGWKSGANSRNDASHPRPFRMPSYEVLDIIIQHITFKFPNLQQLIVVGHSAGGQYAQRYAATSVISDTLCNKGVSTRFIVANPSSYVYMNEERINDNNESYIPNTCSDYNEWKYGLDNLYTYPRRLGKGAIRSNFRNNYVTYLMGTADNDPNDSSLDTSCEAMLQGNNRYDRALRFYQHIQHYFGDNIYNRHKFVAIEGVGHNDHDVYLSPEGMYELVYYKNTICAPQPPTTNPLIVDNTVLLNNQQLTQNSFSINYNNPEVFIYIENYEDAEVQVLNENGVQKYSKLLDQHTLNINLSFLESGTYIIALTTSDLKVYKEVVKI